MIKQLAILSEQAFLALIRSTKTTWLVGATNNHVLDDDLTLGQESGHLEP